jgi:hypothetical protein
MSTPLSSLPDVYPGESVPRIFTNNDRISIDDDDDDIYGTPLEPRCDCTLEAAYSASRTAFSDLFNLKWEYLVVTKKNKNDPCIDLKVQFLIQFFNVSALSLGKLHLGFRKPQRSSSHIGMSTSKSSSSQVKHRHCGASTVLRYFCTLVGMEI